MIDPRVLKHLVKSGAKAWHDAGFQGISHTTGEPVVGWNTEYDKSGHGLGVSDSLDDYAPGTANQTIAAGQYLSGAQTIAGDADLIAANILSTANIFGVQGNVPVIANTENGTVTKAEATTQTFTTAHKPVAVYAQSYTRNSPYPSYSIRMKLPGRASEPVFSNPNGTSNGDITDITLSDTGFTLTYNSTEDNWKIRWFAWEEA